MNRIAFIEGHGTGTRVGDPAEVWAIGSVIGKNRRAPVPIGSIKSNIGHTEPASGLFGLLKAVIALENNFLPATLHIERTNEDIDFEDLNVRVNTSPIELMPAKTPRFAGVNSFGFGGTNAHVVISDPDPVAPPEPQAKGDRVIFMASAHSASALEGLLDDYKQRLEQAETREARQLVASAVANREAMRHRFAVKAKDSDGVLAAISAHLAGEPTAGEHGEVPGQGVRVAFVFAGNGSQWPGMGVDAYRENAHFRQCFQSFSALFEYYLGEKLTDLLFSKDLPERLADTKIAQPMLFAVQAALTTVFRRRDSGPMRFWSLSRRNRRCLRRQGADGRRSSGDRRQALAASGPARRRRQDGSGRHELGCRACFRKSERLRQYLHRSHQRAEFSDDFRPIRRGSGLPRRRPQGADRGACSRY
ncbi:hypothetical protein AJ87_08560 [Rhizobium yanglingense]|nr:hypothetical protein AJ87_08560 [Rhizobium yanglingense]